MVERDLRAEQPVVEPAAVAAVQVVAAAECMAE